MSQGARRGISDLSEIISILKQKSSVNIDSSEVILIGSRAALQLLHDFRHKNERPDYDIICSSTSLIKWLKDRKASIDTIEMIIPSYNGGELDLYVACILKDGIKYDFVIPRLSTSYSVYLMNNIKTWTYSNRNSYSEGNFTRYASEKLLLILKKYMLYYPHQWQKTAKDYRRLLMITDRLTDEDKELCNLFIQYNEKLHGQRQPDADQFVVKSFDNQESIIIKRDEFLSKNKDERIACVYQIAKQLSICEDLLIGLEQICTTSPPWLVDFIIDNWIDIANEKFKNIFHPRASLSIQYEINNHRLLEDLPELAIQKILFNITDPLDFYSMKFVCKRWYTILNRESFWRDLYTSRWGRSSEDRTNWKLAYVMKLIYRNIQDQARFDQLVNATLHLRQTTANEVLRLWENLTCQSQSVNSDLLGEIDYILSHSYYEDLRESPGEFLRGETGVYSAILVLNGFDHPRSQSKVHVDLREGEHGSSSCSIYGQTIYVQFDENSEKRRWLSFGGTSFGGYSMESGFITGRRDYYYEKEAGLTEVTSEICPRFSKGLVYCLFSMMVHPTHRTQFISYLKRVEKNNNRFRHK